MALVRQLHLYLDKNGLIRCGGRIHNAPVDELTKFPYLLTPKHPFTNLVIEYTHRNQLHTGVNSTVTALRQKFRIPAACQSVKSVLRHCVNCRKVVGKPYQAPDPAPLPKSRIQELVPFKRTGVDFTGALYVKSNGQEEKVYICLFTCTVTRAVHLEVVNDLSEETIPPSLLRLRQSKVITNEDDIRQCVDIPFSSKRIETALRVTTFKGRIRQLWCRMGIYPKESSLIRGGFGNA